MYTPPLLPILQYCPYCPLLYTVRTAHCYIYLLYGINRSLLFQPSTCHYLRASYTGDPDSTRMPPKMEPAAATDIDQRIATAVAAALAASRGAQAAAAPAAVKNVAVKLPEFWVADPDPPSLRDHLAAADLDTADEMADLADKLWDARNSQSISAVADSVAAVRPFSPSRSGRSPDRRPQQQQHHRQSTPHHGRGRDSSWCRNHRKFGDKTNNCTAPCSYSSEN